jgi:hypothetical protein
MIFGPYTEEKKEQAAMKNRRLFFSCFILFDQDILLSSGNHHISP